MSDWDKIATNDYQMLVARLRAVAVEKSLKISTLGILDDGSQIHLLESQPKRGDVPRILVAAGFHGEECGGVWGVLHFLEQTPAKKLERLHLSFIPVANPTGFSNRLRHNIWGESPNCGFCHRKIGEPEPSRDGRILIQNLNLLVHRAGNGFLSLHEDDEQTGFYVYTFEKRPAPGPFTHHLVSILSRYFFPVKDGIYDGACVKSGLAYRHCDGSFEDYLFHKGVVHTACTETPATVKLSIRVDANSALINAFATFALSQI
jgi:hypothetical protein